MIEARYAHWLTVLAIVVVDLGDDEGSGIGI
jgi:hypothetical protein